MLREFRMPDAGEGLTEAEILEWRVAVGDTVAVNQVLVEVETAKAAIELPCPWAGTITQLLAGPGDVVAVGAPLLRVETADDEPADLPPTAPDEHRSGPVPPTDGTAPESASGAVLVGYGVRTDPSPRRRPRATPHGAEHVEPGPPGVPARPMRHGGLEQARAVEGRLAGEPAARAKPPVRRLARELGVDLDAVAPSGPGGSITHDDVTAAARLRAGDQEVALSHVTRMMAQAVTESAFTAPHVTMWRDVDVTGMTQLVRAAQHRPNWSGTPLSPLPFAALALAHAARTVPTINATLEPDGRTLRLHGSVHLGVAVDSPRGLVVPCLRDAGALDLRGMAEALADLVATARAGRTAPDLLRGSTITLTNIGALGVDGGTPILNRGEVAILGLGRVMTRPWVVEGRVVPRDVVTLSLSFDHRVVDGATGARALQEVAALLSDPATALTLG